MFMRHIIYSLFILGFCFAFSSCANKQYSVLFEQKNQLSDTSGQNRYQKTPADYRIKPHDLIQIRNLHDIKFIANDIPEISTPGGGTPQQVVFEVKDDGTLSLPSLGEVNVGGLTRVEANRLVQELYHKTLLKEPIIELKITNLSVSMFGEVKAPGIVPLTKDRTTLVDMIGVAGGLGDKADGKNVKIIRGTQKNPKVTVIDLSNIQSINDPDAILQSGDIIYVPQNKRAIRNDNMQNFTSTYQPFIIIFSTILLIFTLVRR